MHLSQTFLLLYTLETSGKIKKLGETGPEYWLEHQVCAHSIGGKMFQPLSCPLSHRDT